MVATVSGFGRHILINARDEGVDKVPIRFTVLVFLFKKWPECQSGFDYKNVGRLVIYLLQPQLP